MGEKGAVAVMGARESNTIQGRLARKRGRLFLLYCHTNLDKPVAGVSHFICLLERGRERQCQKMYSEATSDSSGTLSGSTGIE
jgi:hypothetical protein